MENIDTELERALRKEQVMGLQRPYEKKADNAIERRKKVRDRENRIRAAQGTTQLPPIHPKWEKESDNPYWTGEKK